VRLYFEKICGKISKIVVNEDKFFGFIEFESTDSIQKALELSNTMFQQNKIKVEKSKSPIFSTIEKKRKRDEEEDKNFKKKKI
jgi:RNA recognition motif-containing protein